MKNIVSIVGARPQFVKAAVLSRLIRGEYADSISEYLVHTGQHYDENMSEQFFREMEIPKPDINLEVGSGSHGLVTGRMLEKIEAVLLERKPDAVLVYGDTNSTLAGALAASKLHIPVAHVEAGLRSFNMRMPEEQNRVLTDHVSSHLFCPTDASVNNLNKEGVTKGIYRTGDIMYDASLYYRKKKDRKVLNVPEDYYLLTLHRAENTDDPKRLRAIVNAINKFSDLHAVFPVHPRTKKALDRYGLFLESNVHIIDPVGYFEILFLEDRCQFVVTDSGGLQKEAWFFNKPCITLRNETEWIETVEAGGNILVGDDEALILEALYNPPVPKEWYDLYGDGKAGQLIINLISEKLK